MAVDANLRALKVAIRIGAAKDAVEDGKVRSGRRRCRVALLLAHICCVRRRLAKSWRALSVL